MNPKKGGMKAEVALQAKPAFIPVNVSNNDVRAFAEIEFSNGNIVILYESVSSEYLKRLIK